ncbi:MAG: hypothetical protein FWE69_02315 [Clostridiales bacterium]|nr:hypothetical protein [Clostridiales bacterium]
MPEASPDDSAPDTFLIGGQEVSVSAERFVAQDSDFDLEAFRALLPSLPALSSVDLTKAKVDGAAVYSLSQDFPQTQFLWRVSLGGQSVLSNVESVEARNTDGLLAELPYLPDLKTVRILGQAENPEGQKACKAIADALPDVLVVWDFPLYGKIFSTDDETVNLDKTRIQNTEALREAIPYFKRLNRVEIDKTGLTDTALGVFVDEFPQIRFVWSVSVGGGAKHIKTDATYFNTMNMNSYDLDSLRWCRDMVALDLGHNKAKNLDFLRPLKKLEILILAGCRVRGELDVLAELPNLTYLEVFGCGLRNEDAIALAKLTQLEDLNIGFNYISDLSPLYECTWLKRLWVCKQNKKIPSEETQAALRERLPDCEFSFHGYSSTEDGWRKHPRYYWMRDMLHTYYMNQ